MTKSASIDKLLIIALFFWSASLSAQYNLDSLKTIIANPKLHDTTKLANIALIVDNLYENVESVKYTNLMGKIAQKNLYKKNLNEELRKKYTMYLAAYYNNVSIQLEESGNLKSLAYLQKSMDLYHSVNADDEYYSSLVSKGLLLSRRKRYKEAIDCYYTALKYFEKDKQENADGISYVYSNMGVLYGEQYQFTDAIKFLKRAIYYIDIKKQKITLEDELQKCGMYYNIGAAYVTLKNYGEAKKYLNIALKLAQKTNQSSYMSYAYCKLAEMDIIEKKLDEAEAKLIKAKELSDNDLSMSFVFVRLGELYYNKKEYQKAKEYLTVGLEGGKRIRNSDLQQESYQLLYEISKLTGDYKKSLEMIELYHKIEDSIKVQDNKEELRRQNLKYSYEKKELKFKLETERKNNLLIVLLGLFLLLFVIGYFLYKNSKQKQAIANFEKNELNQKLLLSQMNPHFIFNSIDNIQSLIYNKQDKEAVNYLTKFSKLTRQILENSNESYIALSEELTMIDNYLSIQQLLYNNKFDFNIEVDDAIDTEVILLPPMLTQPFIENAIKHGLKNTTQKGEINISFKLEKEKLLFEINDNGVGFTNNEPVNKKSLAMKITKERLVNISGKDDFQVHTENRLDSKKNTIGAKVFFEIPYIYEN
ncbi:tetratricopeptide repeat-containing sensor histidine kinase [Flavobacterium wongokense]|uniref:tetratricopeptide repeat-containing sensor histidine kinase n=1 Tax=Flavobacterium wongokense TaxID=2910674 RepID=UPI001F3D30D4|nr:histidine kinase [Flavobacterium sp. WG47]MCF6132598.1 histidine kinase [Flavobacterium sp. WG47]